MGRPAVVFICDCEGMHCAHTLTEDGSSQPPKRLVHKTLLTSEFREIYVPVMQPSQTNYFKAHMHQRVIQSGNCCEIALVVLTLPLIGLQVKMHLGWEVNPRPSNCVLYTV